MAGGSGTAARTAAGEKGADSTRDAASARGREYMAVRSFLKKVKGERAKEKTLRPRIMGRKASPSAVPPKFAPCGALSRPR